MRAWLPFGTGFCLGAGLGTIPVDAALGFGVLTLGVLGTQVLLWKGWL